MKLIKKTLTILGIPLFLISCAIDPGSTESINSASKNCRNIIGIEISNPTIQQKAAARYNGDGVYVSAVIPKHPARITGLKVGDIITKINGTPVTDISEALLAINCLEAGRIYPFEVYRNSINGRSQNIVINILIEQVQERSIAKIS